LTYLIRFARILVPPLSLGVVACVLGCEGTGGMGSSPPPTKEAAKAIAEDMKNAQQERMKAMRKNR
jgi:hypothetical protein